jgi:ubiquitin-protein ligase E3 A
VKALPRAGSFSPGNAPALAACRRRACGLAEKNKRPASLPGARRTITHTHDASLHHLLSFAGSSDAGRLAASSDASSPASPSALTALPGGPRRWGALSLGARVSVGIGAHDGAVYAWGANDWGQLGVVPVAGGEGAASAATATSPARVAVLKGWPVKAVAAGANHVVALTDTDVITWGRNDAGQAGQGARSEVGPVKPRSLRPLQGARVVAVACGADHTLALTATSVVFAWGANGCGQLGVGDTAPRRAPVVVSGLWGLPVVRLAAGGCHSAALTAAGALFTWGDNAWGQLGHGSGGEVVEEEEGGGASAPSRFALVPAEEADAAPPASTSPPRPPLARRPVNHRFLAALVAMGIPEAQAVVALAETGSVGVEVATEWLFSVPEAVLDRLVGGGGKGEGGGRAAAMGDGGGGTPPTPDTPTSPSQYDPLPAASGGAPAPAIPASCVALPRRVRSLAGVVLVAAGPRHMVAAAAGGGLWAWGDAAAGAGGVPPSSPGAAASAPSASPPSSSCLYVPVRVGGPATTYGTITALAAGEEHTLILVAAGGGSGRVWGCGQAAGGRLPGAPAGAPPIIAPPVRLAPPTLATPGSVAWGVAATTAGSALLVRGPGEDNAIPSPSSSLQPALADRLRDAISAAAADAASAAASASRDPTISSTPDRTWPSAVHLKPILAAVELVFGSASSLAAAFVRPPGADPAPTGTALTASSPAGVGGLDCRALDDAYTRLLGLYGPAFTDTPVVAGGPPQRAATASVVALCSASVSGALYKATNALLDDLHRHARALGSPERAALLLAAAQCPLLADRAAGGVLVPRLCHTILRAPRTARARLVGWWADYPADLLATRVVAPLQAFLTAELCATKKLTAAVMHAIKVLALVEEANAAGRALPPDAFYNELISEKLDVEDHYVAWRQSHDAPAAQPGSDGPFSFCSYPFLLNARAKSRLLHTEARFLMTQTVHQARIEHVAAGGGGGGGGNGEGAAAVADPEEEGRVVPDKRSAAAEARAVAAADAAARDAAAAAAGAGASAASRALPRSTASLRGLLAAVWRGAPVAPTTPEGPPPPGSTHGALGPPSATPGSHSASASPGDGPAATSAAPAPPLQPALLSSDARAAAAREVTAAATREARASAAGSSRAATPAATPTAAQAAAAAAAVGLPSAVDPADQAAHHHPAGPIRHGSMNLPPPEASGVPATHPDMCIIRVRRTHLLEDGLAEVGRQRPRDLLKPLRVHFIGEDGIDAGGVKKEFFQLLVTELLSPDYGMLVYLPESRTYWFHAASLEGEDAFMLLGLVLGLAVYNAVLLDFPLPLALYRQLLGQPPQLRDLEEMEPTLGRSLRQLLDWEPPADDPAATVEATFCATFTASVPGVAPDSGPPVEVPLVPGGEALPVTADNRAAYVEAYVHHVLVGSVAPQFEAFARGFAAVCGGPAVHLFSATELERLVCGSPSLDFGALRKSARYEGGYTADAPAVTWLWEVVEGELSGEEARRFLKFFTGSDRAPIGGLGALRVTIQRDGAAGAARLPTAHTCFNTLLLPAYPTKAVLADRLKLAIMNSEGFGLE